MTARPVLFPPARRLLAIAAAIACVASVVGNVHAAETDPWFGRDKALHFGVSAALGAGGYAGSALVFDRPAERAVSGASFSLILGGAKEFYDHWAGGDPSYRDLVWDAAGTAVGVGLALLVDLAMGEPAGGPAGRHAQGLGVRF